MIYLFIIILSALISYIVYLNIALSRYKTLLGIKRSVKYETGVVNPLKSEDYLMRHGKRYTFFGDGK